MESITKAKEQPVIIIVSVLQPILNVLLVKLSDTRILGGRCDNIFSVPKKISPVESFNNGCHSPRLSFKMFG